MSGFEGIGIGWGWVDLVGVRVVVVPALGIAFVAFRRLNSRTVCCVSGSMDSESNPA